MNEHIKRAIEKVGSQAALARAIKKSNPFINDMLYARKRVPAELCAAIEEACGGAVTRYQLRPDVFGSPSLRKRKAG